MPVYIGASCGVIEMKISKLGLFFRGLAMGAADVIPGVSGGTIAFVTGIYQELIDTLSGLGPKQVVALFRGDFRSILRDLNLSFTLPLGVGILTALLSFAKLMPFLIREYPFQTFTFFFGLILCSSYVPFSKMKKNGVNLSLLFVSLILSAVFFYMNPNFSFPQTPIGFFTAGAIAICAMILPGISGAYLLVLMGQYQHVLEALHTRDLSVAGIFALGCLCGLLLFVRLLKYLLHHHLHTTLAVLTGLMLGSLLRVWPFAHSVATDELTLTYSISGVLFLSAIGIMILLIRLDPDFSKTTH